MRSFEELKMAKLEWLQPKATVRAFELRTSGEALATLSFKSSFGSLAACATEAGTWTFKRVGFFSPTVTVRADGSSENVATYLPKLLVEGTLVFRDGRTFRWKPTSFWLRSWAFVDMSDQPVVTLTSGVEHQKLTDFFKTQMTVEIAEGAGNHEETPILVGLALYLLLLRQRDSAAVASTGGA